MTPSAKASAICAIIGTLVTGTVLSDQLTFDRELVSSENRITAQTTQRDRDILAQMMARLDILTAQSRAQYLTLRQDLLKEQIERLQDVLQASDRPRPWIAGRIKALEGKRQEVEGQLEAHLLGRLP